MNNRYVIYNEILLDHSCERWFYGCYESANRANEIAIELNRQQGDPCVFACVCKANEATAFKVKNLPAYLC